MSARIPILNRDGEVAAITIVDDEDYEWAMQWSWHLDNGYAGRNGRKAAGERTTVRLHRELLGLTHGDGLQGDHVNHDRLDNRRSNLRVVTLGQNLQNVSARRGSTSQYRGVCWDARCKKWAATVSLNRRTHNLGRFDDELEAAQVAADFRRQHMPYTVEAEAA